MKRFVSATLAALCLVAPLGYSRPAVAEPILEAVPAEAWGMVCVPNMSALDKKLVEMAQVMNTPPMSPLMMAKGMLGLVSGVDDAGSLAFIFMPVENFDMAENGMAVLIPTSSYADLLAMFTPEDVGDGVSKILLSEEESYIANKGTYAVVGPNADTVKKILKSTKGVGSAMSAHSKKRFAGDDITAWGNLGAVFASPAFEAVKSTEAMEPGAKEMFDLLMQFDSAALSLAINPEGFKLGMYYRAKEGSDAAKAMAGIAPPTQGMLAGLPAENHVFAWGQAGSKENAQMGAEFIEKMFANIPAEEMPMSKEALDTVRPLISNLIKNMRQLAVGVSNLPEGPDGLLAVTAIIGVDGGADAYLQTVDKLVDAVLQGLPPEQAELMTNALTYQPKVEGATDFLKLDPAVMGAAETEVANMYKIIGKDGLIFRMTPVGSTSVAMTLGGGAAWASQVVALAGENKAPLYEDANIKSASQAKPAKCIAEGYFSLNGLSTLVAGISKAVDEPAPFPVPEVNAPVSIFLESTGDGGGQYDVNIPIDLIKAIGQIVGGMMGAGGPPPQM